MNVHIRVFCWTSLLSDCHCPLLCLAPQPWDPLIKNCSDLPGMLLLASHICETHYSSIFPSSLICESGTRSLAAVVAAPDLKLWLEKPDVSLPNCCITTRRRTTSCGLVNGAPDANLNNGPGALPSVPSTVARLLPDTAHH